MPVLFDDAPRADRGVSLDPAHRAAPEATVGVVSGPFGTVGFTDMPVHLVKASS